MSSCMNGAGIYLLHGWSKVEINPYVIFLMIIHTVKVC